MTQTNKGILDSVMPLQRMQNVVAITLMALAMLPTPLTRMPRIQIVGAVCRAKMPAPSAARMQTIRHRAPSPRRTIRSRRGS